MSELVRKEILDLSLAFWAISIGFLQFFLNLCSKWIKYEYKNCYKWLAIILSIAIFSWFYLNNSTLHEPPSFFVYLIGCLIPIVISIVFIDLKYFEIPNSYTLVILFLGLIYAITSTFWLNYFLGGVFAFIVFLFLHIFAGGNLGMGDVKLAGALGLFIGKEMVLNFLFITFFSGAISSIFLILLRIKDRKDKIAFAPYIIFSFLWIIVL